MIRRRSSIGWLAVFAIAACGSGASSSPGASWGVDSTDSPGRSTGVPRDDLVARDAPGHYRISAPADWQVSQDTAGRVVAGDDSTRLTVWPFFATGSSFSIEGATSAMQRWTAEVVPDATFGSVEPAGSGIAARGTTANGDDAVALVNWTAVSGGTTGTAVIVEAVDLAAVAPTIAAILATFRPEGSPVEGDDGPTLDFTTWRDPTEGAFSVEVPSGWQVEGGVVRASLVVQSYIFVTSPDAAIEVIMGDAFGYFVEPNDTLAFAGLGEGDTYTDQMGNSWPIISYRPGAAYLTDVFFPESGQPVEVTSETDRPDIAATIPTLDINEFAAGEVEYRLGDRIGQAMAITERVAIEIGGTWHPWRLVLVTTPPDRAAEAAQAVTRLVDSFAIDPGWAAAQAQLTAAQSRIITEQNAVVSSIISDGYWGRQAVHDALSTRREQAILEVVDLVDDAGNTYRVDAGSDYYWIGADGTVVGTDTSASPDVNYGALLTTP